MIPNTKVPLPDLDAHYAPIRDDILAAITEVVDSHAFILGPKVQECEERIAAYCQTEFAIGVSSGSDALLVGLMALDIGSGDEVITTPYSFFATAGCIVRLGARPVFVDIDPVTYNIDSTKIEEAVTAKTKAIIPVHLYGQCAEMEQIMDIARRHGIPVVEDAAQAIGAQDRHARAAGSMGELGCLSFFPSKNLSGLGDGGMVVTNDEAIAEKIRVLRAHGGKPKYHHQMIGGNFRLDAIQAAALNVKLDCLDQWTSQRQQNARRYTALFTEAGLTDEFGIQLPQNAHQADGVRNYHIYNQFVIRVPDRDAVRAHLQDAGIATALYYPVPFHLQECFNSLGHGRGDFPQAEQAAEETLALPIYPEMTREQQLLVVRGFTTFYTPESVRRRVTTW